MATEDPIPPLCACGCGLPVNRNKREPRWYTWVIGHHHHARSPEKHYHWRGGQTIKNGYVFVYAPDHHRARGGPYTKRCYLVMEAHLGRLLKADEEVHHKNEDKTDDRIENLQVLTKREHMRLHMRDRHKMPSVSSDVQPDSGKSGDIGRTRTA